jgi:hypothetical protein
MAGAFRHARQFSAGRHVLPQCASARPKNGPSFREARRLGEIAEDWRKFAAFCRNAGRLAESGGASREGERFSRTALRAGDFADRRAVRRIGTRR